MEQLLTTAAAKEGIFVVMFVALLLYTMRSNSNREAKYQDVIKTLSERIPCMEDDLREIGSNMKMLLDWMKPK